MLTLWNIVVKNLSNIISLIGIVLTVYLGIFYVPSWLEDAEKQKFINAEASIEQSIKELIYSDTTCRLSEIHSLVRAKEIALEKTYPLTVEQILVKVESSFMDDKFLPLEKRRQLVAECQLIRKNLPLTPQMAKEKKSSTSLLGWLSIILTIVATSGAIFGYYQSYIKEKETQEEINNQLDQAEQQLVPSLSGYAFEQEIVSALDSFPGIKIIRRDHVLDRGFDVEFTYKERTVFVEVKYLTSSKIGLASIQAFFARQKGLQGEFWYVHNNELTKMSKNRFEELSLLFGSVRASKLVQAASGTEFSEKLKMLLN